MRLKYQLFLTLLLAGSLLIALMAAFNTWSFNRGFLNYINDAEIARLQPLVKRLGTQYGNNGSWEWLEKNQQAWAELIGAQRSRPRDVGPRDVGPRDVGPRDVGPRDVGPRDVGPRDVRPRDVGPRNGDARDVRPRDVGPRNGDARDVRPRNGGQRNGPREPRNNPDKDRKSRRPDAPGVNGNTVTIDPRLILADADKQPLLGRIGNPSAIRWLPITSEETVVGYVGARRINQLSGQIDQVFVQQQKRSYLYVALAMLAVSGLLAIALASRIVKPILGVNNAVDSISKGQFGTRTNSSRKDEIGDLSRNIDQLAFTLESNQQARQQWVAEISHELRTPVAILQGEIEALQDGVITVDDLAIESLHTETTRLSRLINDLHELTLSDIGALNYQMDTLALQPLIQERLNAANAATSGKAIEVQVQPAQGAITIRGDDQRLAQLFDNLLQNTVRYTDEGGLLQISTHSIDGFAVIEWADSSPGVTTEQLPRLFDSLYRTDSSRNRQHGGSGLGLAIVEKIVTAHQGRIEAYHSPHGGLGIRIHLPQATPG